MSKVRLSILDRLEILEAEINEVLADNRELKAENAELKARVASLENPIADGLMMDFLKQAN